MFASLLNGLLIVQHRQSASERRAEQARPLVPQWRSHSPLRRFGPSWEQRRIR